MPLELATFFIYLASLIIIKPLSERGPYQNARSLSYTAYREFEMACLLASLIPISSETTESSERRTGMLDLPAL